MSYKNLADFQAIINSEEFAFISDSRKVERIVHIMKSLVFVGNQSIGELQAYFTQLQVFYHSFPAKNVPDFREGFRKCQEIFQLIFNLGKKGKLSLLPRGKTRDFAATFLYGINRLANGIKIAFDPELIGNTTLAQGELARYILDKKVGLGSRISFNKLGRSAPVSLIPRLPQPFLVKIIRLLQGKPALKGKWLVFGERGDPVRIVASKQFLRGLRVYAIFLVEGHDKTSGPYSTLLVNYTPADVPFAAAA